MHLPQHADEYRPERPILLAVDQELGDGSRLGFLRDIKTLIHHAATVRCSGGPPGIRTPNLRIKSLVMECWSGSWNVSELRK